MCFNQTGDISRRNGSSLKLVDKFTYLGNSVSSTKTDINTRLAKSWTAISRLSVIWKSDLTDKMKQFFPSSGRVDTAVVSPPLLRSVNGAVNTNSTEILVLTSTSAKECYPRIHRLSLFSSLSFSLSLSLSLWPISGDSSSCRRRPKTEEEAVAEEIPNTKHTCWPPDIF